MVISLDRPGADFLEATIIDPKAISAFTTPKPALRFSDTAPTDLSAIRGLSKIGPYDANTTDSFLRRSFDRCEVLCAYPKGETEIHRDLTRLITYVGGGYSKPGDARDARFEPFAETFLLSNAVFPAADDFLEYDMRDLDPFEKAVMEQRAAIQQRGNRPIVVVASQSHRSIGATRDVYVPLKRLLNRADIPNQFASYYEVAGNALGVLSYVRANDAVGWSVWNLALGMYTKLGGIPWTVQQSGRAEEHIDISIGLRFARLREGEEGFCLGVATVLDRFGRLIGTVPLENLGFHRALDHGLRGMTLTAESTELLVTGALDKVLLDPHTQPIMQVRRPISIVIHKLGPGLFHDEEIQGIRDAMAAKLRGKKALVAFVPVAEKETFAAFGASSQGRAIPQGQAVRLNDNTALLYTVPSDKPFKAPITVKLQNMGEDDCAFQTVEQACIHTHTLCGLHWQMVSSGRMKLPADLRFAQNVAQAFADDIQPSAGSWLWKTHWYL